MYFLTAIFYANKLIINDLLFHIAQHTIQAFCVFVLIS